MQDLRFSQQCSWGFRSSGMWHHVIGQMVPNLSKGTQCFQLTCPVVPDKGTAFFQDIRNHLSNTVSHPRRPESYILPVMYVILYRKIWKAHTEKNYNLCTQRKKILRNLILYIFCAMSNIQISYSYLLRTLYHTQVTPPYTGDCWQHKLRLVT
jgi:hypothetical protein